MFTCLLAYGCSLHDLPIEILRRYSIPKSRQMNRNQSLGITYISGWNIPTLRADLATECKAGRSRGAGLPGRQSVSLTTHSRPPRGACAGDPKYQRARCNFLTEEPAHLRAARYTCHRLAAKFPRTGRVTWTPPRGHISAGEAQGFFFLTVDRSPLCVRARRRAEFFFCSFVCADTVRGFGRGALFWGQLLGMPFIVLRSTGRVANQRLIHCVVASFVAFL